MNAAVSNLEQVLKFTVNDHLLQRRLTRLVEDLEDDLSADSPVGRALLAMEAGAVTEVQAPGGPVTVALLDVREQGARESV